MQAPGGGLGGLDGGLGNVGGGITGLVDIANVFRGLYTMLTSPQFWIRLGEGIAGAVLIYEALRSLTGQGPSTARIVGAPVRAAKTASKDAALAATIK